MPKLATQSGSKTVLSPIEIARLAHNAGFGYGKSGDNQTVHIGPIIIATTIALAESGGKVRATNHNTNGSIDRGLWQINSVHSQFDSERLLSDPEYNAKAAYQIYQQQGWEAWYAYRSGAAGKQRKRVTKAIAKNMPALLSGEPIPGNFATALDETARGIGGSIAGLISFIVDGGLIRIASVIGGALAILAGLLMLSQEVPGIPTPKIGG